MASLAHHSLTNYQALRRDERPGVLSRIMATLRLWRRRSRERQALAELSELDLKDFGATRVDVYREMSAPFWRAAVPITPHHGYPRRRI